jgi:copper resistance protein C
MPSRDGVRRRCSLADPLSPRVRKPDQSSAPRGVSSAHTGDVTDGLARWVNGAFPVLGAGGLPGGHRDEEEACRVSQAGAASSSRAGTVTAVAVGCLFVGGFGFLAAAPASAHASLVRSSPADGSSVATPPTTVSLTFDENIRMPSVILVRDAGGASVVNGKTSVVDNVARRRVGLGTSGTYTVVYRVVSADGHPVSGRLSFGVGGAPAGNAAGSSEPVAVNGEQDSTGGGAPTRVIGMVAALALLGGVGLLTVRRWAPDLWNRS